MAHVLVIDNDPFNRMLLADTLSSCASGTTVAAVAHGAKSIDEYRAHHPDLIIAEIRRPCLQGIDAILDLCELDHELPVLLTSLGRPIKFMVAGAMPSNEVRKCDLLSTVRTCLSDATSPIHNEQRGQLSQRFVNRESSP